MKSVQFVFALHDHQPVGNFDHVFAEAYEKAYLPFLELLEAYRGFRAVLHHTGPLLEWIEGHRPDYLARLRALVGAGQVEILGGAFYEPILPVIPEADRLGQIRRMSDWLERVFGVRPRGIWLAERVWEPSLPSTMAAAGIEYTVLDDSHFALAGLPRDELFGYYLTEDAGAPVAVFPIHSAVRHRIPYAQPDETIDFLREAADPSGARAVVMADDGEKFGVWPDSNWYCYQEGWMYRFVERIVNNCGWIEMRTFSELLDTTAPLGRVYLPAASYGEMMQWAMPARANLELRDVRRRLHETGQLERAGAWMHGGFWRSFFARYEESNHLHKRVLHVSAKLAGIQATTKTRARLAQARDHLWRAQCNCAYWHGVFGGIYLPHLRHALYSNLIAADSIADDLLRGGKRGAAFLARDFDIDGAVELLVETPAHALMLKPAAGGVLVEHDIRPARVNLIDTLMRRREAYHETLDADAPARPRAREENLQRFLAQDWYRRASLVDHIMANEATPELFRSAVFPELGDFVNHPYELEWETVRGGGRIRMTRDGAVLLRVGAIPVRVEKTIAFRADTPALRIDYRVTNDSDVELDALFGVEFNVNLLAGNAPDRYHVVDGVNLGGENALNTTGRLRNVTRFALVDEWQKLRVQWQVSQPAEHWRLPIETVSESENGLERVYQSTVVMPVWRLRLTPGRTFEAAIDYAVELL